LILFQLDRDPDGKDTNMKEYKRKIHKIPQSYLTIDQFRDYFQDKIKGIRQKTESKLQEHFGIQAQPQQSSEALLDI
jgi:hypothetical protein